MDGIHDLGGMQGFGAVAVEANEPVFHEPWQEIAFAVMFAAQAVIRDHSADAYRHSVERMAPAHYLSSHYYERMLTGTVTLLVEHGVLDLDDLERRCGGKFPLAQPVAESPMLDLSPAGEARFVVGDKVRVKDIHPTGHVRAPRFCRGQVGTVLKVNPEFTFPDTSAHGGPHRKEVTYHVEFPSAALWSDVTSETDTVIVDLWDSYLEATDE